MPIHYNGLDLPEWLFDLSQDKAAGASPTASLSFDTSLNKENPWKSEITPSSKPKPKCIILTEACLTNMSKLDLMSLSGWFQANDFKVYLSTQNNDMDIHTLKSWDNDLSAKVFDTLTDFDPKCDYETLGNTFQIPRDKVLVLDHEKTKELIHTLEQHQSISDEDPLCRAQGYKISFHKFFHKDNDETYNRMDYIKYLLEFNPDRKLLEENIQHIKKFSEIIELIAFKDHEILRDALLKSGNASISNSLQSCEIILARKIPDSLFKTLCIKTINPLQHLDSETDLKELLNTIFRVYRNIDIHQGKILLDTLAHTLKPDQINVLFKIICDTIVSAGFSSDISEHGFSSVSELDHYKMQKLLLDLLIFLPEKSLLLSPELKKNLSNNLDKIYYYDAQPMLGLNEDLAEELIQDCMFNNYKCNTLPVIQKFVNVFHNNSTILKTLFQKRERIVELDCEKLLLQEDIYLTSYLPYLTVPQGMKIVQHFKAFPSTICYRCKNLDISLAKAIISKVTFSGNEGLKQLILLLNDFNDHPEMVTLLTQKRDRLIESELQNISPTKTNDPKVLLNPQELLQMLECFDTTLATKIFMDNIEKFQGQAGHRYVMESNIANKHPALFRTFLKLNKDHCKITNLRTLVAYIKNWPEETMHLIDNYMRNRGEKASLQALFYYLKSNSFYADYEKSPFENDSNEYTITFMERYFPKYCASILLDQYTEENTNLKKLKNNITKTYLFLADLNSKISFEHLQQLLLDNKLKSLTIIEIAYFDPDNTLQKQRLQSLIHLIQTHCPNIKQLVLPKSALDQLDLDVIKLPIQVSNTIEISLTAFEASPNEIKETAEFNPNHSLNPQKLTDTQHNKKRHEPAITGVRQKNKFYSATGTHATIFDTNNPETNSFNMEESGELLNTDIDAPNNLRLRKSIIIRDLTISPNETSYTPSLDKLNQDVKDHEIQHLTESDLNICKRSKKNLYFQFKTKLTKDNWVRLTSVDAEDKLYGLVNMAGKNISITKGDDGFFYAKSNEDISLHYVLSIPTIPVYTFNNLADNVKKLINGYKASPLYKVTSDDNIPMPVFEAHNPGLYLQVLYDTRAGVCRHRVEALQYRLSKLKPKPDLRIVNIDNNHERLEIKIQGVDGLAHWVQVDLGGGGANMHYPQKVQNTASAHPLPTPVDKKSSQELKILLDSKENAFWALMHPQTQIVHVKEKDELIKILAAPKNKTLLMTKAIEEHVHFLMQESIANKQPVYYLDDFTKIDFNKLGIFLPTTTTQAEISKTNLFERFLLEAKSATNPLLIINWDAFTPQQRLALNTVIDETQCLMGRHFPPQLKTVSLCKEQPDDHSFTTRHDQILQSKIPIVQLNELNPSESQAKIIDLEGLSDWKKVLFGKLSLKKTRLTWVLNDTAKQLLSKDKHSFTIINASKQNKKDIEFAVKQGFFEHYGFKIFLKDNIHISVEDPKNNFNFSQFQATKITSNITAKNIPSNAHVQVINTDIFDRLLLKKSIVNTEYFEYPGLIIEATNNKLELFITSDLTTEQWYCLFSKCAKHHVQLKLFLAPGITLPKGLKQDAEDVKEQSEQSVQEPYIYLSNNPKEALEQLYASHKTPEVFDVEDYTYQDLIFDIDFKASKDGFKDFSVKIKPILQKLIDGETVVLRGEFPEKLCRCLEPILIQKKIELPTGVIPIKGQLKLIVENQDKSLFKWVPKEALIDLPNTKQAQKESITHAQTIVEPVYNNKVDLGLLNEGTEEALKQIKENAAKFIANREKLLLEALKTNSIVQLVGESGVGKSRLLLGLQANQAEENYIIYNELNKTQDWLQNTTQDKTKILFIDEVNVEDKHLTMFSPLKQIGAREILYQDICLTPDLQHKLVTAKNPESYGGGRNKQKLFANNDCVEIHLQDFPASFLYTSILLPIYEQTVRANDIDTKKLPETLFAKDCANYLNHYLRRNALTKESEQTIADSGLTARELQEYALRYCAKQLKSKARIPHHQYKNTQKFVPTQSNAAARVAIENFIDIRRFQREGKLQSGGIGLNGVLIEGTPGTGKSALIKYMLESKGYQIKTSSDEQKSDAENLICYKIDASLSLEQKTHILLRAFHEGNAVWIDEINGCIDDGLEKLLNALLTGVDLDKQAANKSGFMMFATANGISMEGRSLISPAIKHRCLSVQLDKDTKLDVERILKSTFPNENINYALLAEHFDAKRNEDKNMNLRIFLKTIESNMAIVKSAYPSNVVDNQNTVNPKKLRQMPLVFQRLIAIQKTNTHVQNEHLTPVIMHGATTIPAKKPPPPPKRPLPPPPPPPKRPLPPPPPKRFPPPPPPKRPPPRLS